MKRKVCKKCKIFVEANECPICKGDQFITNWQGRVNVLDANKSYIAKRTGVTTEGEYAIKVK